MPPDHKIIGMMRATESPLNGSSIRNRRKNATKPGCRVVPHQIQLPRDISPSASSWRQLVSLVEHSHHRSGLLLSAS